MTSIHPLPLPFFTATLPLPPSINNSYQIVATRRASRRLAASAELCQFKADAALLLCQATHKDHRTIAGIVTSPEKHPLALTLTFYFSTLWKRDIDGGIKACQDAVFTHLGLNDTLVVDLFVRKRVDASNPRVEIRLGCAEG